MRRSTAGVMTVVVLSVTGCTSDPGRASATDPSRRGPEVGAVEVLPGPSGSRWVGMNGVMVAVPAHWRTVTGPCGEPDGPVVHLPGREAPFVDCARLPTTGVASLTMGRVGSLPDPPGGPRVSREVGGTTVRHGPVACVPHELLPTWCSLALVAPGADADFRFSAGGPGAGRLIRTMRDSLAPVPRGHVAVPMVEHGTPVGRASGVLAEAGLEPTSPDVDFPHHATGTRPAAGAIVAEGSTVSLTIGDG